MVLLSNRELDLQILQRLIDQKMADPPCQSGQSRFAALLVFPGDSCRDGGPR
jgi:hypothetical protein